NAADTRGATVAIAFKHIPAAATLENPGAFSNWSTGAWRARSTAIKPALGVVVIHGSATLGATSSLNLGSPTFVRVASATFATDSNFILNGRVERRTVLRAPLRVHRRA